MVIQSGHHDGVLCHHKMKRKDAKDQKHNH